AVTSFAWLAVRAGGGGGATHMRWDLIHLQAGVLSAGGIDWAKAADGSKITLTGSGTWLSTSHGAPQAVSGGGMWEALDKDGVSIGSGDYTVTGLVSSDLIPGVTPAVGTDDKIGNPEDSRAGFLILRVLYS